jgi:alkyl sulfatase BDS1-like metallo-beta-lactamase superfamily hydrolase
MTRTSIQSLAFAFAAASLSLSIAAAQSNDATPSTRAANEAVLAELPFDDATDFELTQKGLIARPESLVIRNEAGRVVWDLEAYAFLTDGSERPDTVNPSQWRQAQLNMTYGLYRVVEGIYQVRGYDLANITFIEGETGWIVIDPLTTRETSRAALDLVEQHLGKRPIKAVIYSHSHADHWGGVKGVISDEDVRAGKVRVIAPEAFMHSAISENVMAGNAMARRVTYQYGSLLPKSPRGQLDSAIGKGIPSGTVTLIAPSDIVDETPTEITIDGVQMIFQNTPGTEAPSEMNTYFPQLKALWMAENCTATLHNLYTLRGAEVRDASAWSHFINEAIELFSGWADVVFASHGWPRWGNAEVVQYLKKQRDLYGYLHDQTLRLANHGYTMIEIAEMLEVPPDLSHRWYNRGYHGTYNHNIKAVYQKYLGWYDGNPANLHPLPPEDAARKYVEIMGGPEKILDAAREAYARGEYRWVAQLVNHVVFADPENQAARMLQADSLEQLGYRSEGAGWRNSYLMASKELREGVAGGPAARTANPDTMSAMSVGMILDFMGVRLNGPKAAGRTIVVNLILPDVGERYVLNMENSHLSHLKDKQVAGADVTLTLDRATLDEIMLGLKTLDGEIEAGDVTVEGNLDRFKELLGLLDAFEFWFAIVTP